MLSTDALEVVLEAVGGEVPRPAPFLKRRLEPEDGILIVSLPRVEKNELMIRILNRVAAAIYLLCDGQRSILEIVEAMRGLAPGEHAPRVTADVLRTVRDLQHEGLLLAPRARWLDHDREK